MMPCPRENRGSLDALSRGCHDGRFCEEVLLVVASSPHLPTRHNKTSEPSIAGWLNNSSPPPPPPPLPPPHRRWSDCDLCQLKSSS
ncbi:uncharacterized protein V6R79_000298 [Siganus canaliculatus]